MLTQNDYDKLLAICEEMDSLLPAEPKPKRKPFSSLDFTQQFNHFGKVCTKLCDKWYDSGGIRQTISPNQMVDPLPYLMNGKSV